MRQDVFDKTKEEFSDLNIELLKKGKELCKTIGVTDNPILIFNEDDLHAFNVYCAYVENLMDTLYDEGKLTDDQYSVSVRRFETKL